MTELDALRQRLIGWMFEAALPLWRKAGIEPHSRAFQDTLDQCAKPMPTPRRARVQARQVYVFAWAGSRGWTGDWTGAARDGLDAFLATHRRPDGFFRHVTDHQGAPIDDRVLTYDQAFSLFALASAAAQLPDRRQVAETYADALLRALDARRLPSRGFCEVGPHPYQSNAHMHLLEAALAWELVSPAPHWRALADEVAELALTHFVDSEVGYLREHFEADWSPAGGADGRIVEPGHQFEWAWLLDRWSRRRGDTHGRAVAARLYRIGADHGVDRARGAAVDRLTEDFAVLDPSARLWPQTERLRAALWFGDQADALEAARCIARYLETPIPGLWWDKLGPDNSFADEPASGSSLYHIVGAVDALMPGAQDAP